MNATAVRFTFSGLFRKFDIMAVMWVSEPIYTLIMSEFICVTLRIVIGKFETL